MTEPATKFYPNIAQSFGITGIVILGMIILSPVFLFLDKFFIRDASMLIYYLLAIGIPFWIVYSIKKKETGDPSFKLAIKNIRIIPLVLVVAWALLFGVISPIQNLIPMPEMMKKAIMNFGSMTGVFAFFLMVMAAPVLEEFIFRGIILDGLLKRYSPIKSILVSSILFGLVHLNPWQFVGAFIIGIFSGWVYYRTQCLSFSIIIHAAVNLTGYILNSSDNIESSMDETLLEMYGGLTHLFLAIIGSIFLATICIFFLRKEFIKGDMEEESAQE